MQRGRFKLYFLTTNTHKFEEARLTLSMYGIEIERISRKPVEIQDESLRRIALFSLKQAIAMYRRPIIVEDSGLFIDSLNGFPGSSSSFVFGKIGVEGILKLLEREEKRDATFVSIVALGSLGLKPRTFTGKVRGRISLEARGTRGFGYDPIFIPRRSQKTFAEMSTEEKVTRSHRGRAFRKLAAWLSKEGEKYF